MNTLKSCFRCVNYRPLEEKLGYCKLFQCIENARANESLCGKLGKWFKETPSGTFESRGSSTPNHSPQTPKIIEYSGGGRAPLENSLLGKHSNNGASGPIHLPKKEPPLLLK